MHRPIVLALGVALLLVAACEKSSPPVEPPTPDPEPPAALLAVVELPSGTDFSKLAAAVGQIAPEAQSSVATGLPMALGQLLGEAAAPVDAIELDGPMRLLVVDVEAGKPEILFVVRGTDKLAAADGYALSRLGKDTLIGPPAAVALVEGFAAHLVTEPITELRATALPGNLLAAYGAELDALPGTIAAEAPPSPFDMSLLMKTYVDFIRTLGEGSERVVATVESDSGAAHLIFRLHAHPGSTLSTFIADQRPSSFELLEKLPGGIPSFMVFETSLRASVALEPMLRLCELMFGNDESGKALMEGMRRFADVLNGDSAMLMNMKVDPSEPVPTAEGVAIYGVTDAKLATDIMADLLKRWSGTGMKMMGMEQTLRLDGQEVHRGVQIQKMTQVMSTIVPETGESVVVENHSAFAGNGEHVVYAMGKSSADLTRRALDRVNGDGTGFEASAVLERALIRSKANEDSLLMFFDMSTILPTPAPMPAMVMTLGFDKDVATFTMSAMK